MLVPVSDGHRHMPASSTRGCACVCFTQYRTAAVQHEELTNEGDGTGGPERGGREARGRVTRTEEIHSAGNGKGAFLYLRKHC